MSDTATPARQWHPALWADYPVDQAPEWNGEATLARVRGHLSDAPALTTAADVRATRSAMAAVSDGRGFVLQAGDCAETFGPDLVEGVPARDRLLCELGCSLSATLDRGVVTIGRMAGQFAKPRSQSTETVRGVELPNFKGLMINRPEFDSRARDVDPRRMVSAYYNAKAVFHELHRLAHQRAARMLTATPALQGDGAQESALRTLAEHSSSRGVDGSLSATLDGYGSTTSESGQWSGRGLWTSHEALVLDYEESLTRRDPTTGEWYLASTHLPWVGDRTRDPEGAHVGFLSGVANPVAVKVGPRARTDDVLAVCRRLDPYRVPGRLTLVLRLGADDVTGRGREIVDAVTTAGHPVVWMCDPMHGNTITLPNGVKTRRIDTVCAEAVDFVRMVRGAGQWPGGVHLELTPDDVSECLDGSEDSLGRSYHSLCDPRLNARQARTVVRAVTGALAG